MGKQNHIIRKLIIEIGLPTREEAFNIQNRLTDEYKRIILDIIEEILDRLIGKDEVIRVDKLELDLGNISEIHLSQEISRKVKLEMEGALTKLIHEVKESDGNAAEIRMTTSSGAYFTVHATRQHTARSEFETLVYLLEHGIFPWNDARKEKPSLEQMIALAMERNPDQLRQVLYKTRNKNIFRRLAFQLAKPQLHYLAAILGCSFSSQLSELSIQLQKQVTIFLESNKSKLGGKTAFTSTSFEQQLLEETLAYFASGTNKSAASSSALADPVTDYIFRMLEELFATTRIISKPVLLNTEPGKRGSKTKKGNIAGGTVAAQIRVAFELFIQNRQQQLTEIISSATSGTQQFPETILPVIAGKAQQSEIIAGKQPVKKESSQSPLPEAEEGIYIDNAGLIILHPYLPAFFNNLGLIEGKSFVNDEAKFKAIHLLQWLTYGDEKKTEYVEHELVLNKLLCAVAVSEPVPVSMSLSEKEKENAIILLNAVITNWPIMNNSSIHALRTTFLQKAGRLMYGENNWNLLIERDSAVEVLIDRLPWSISMVKLPWNEHTIYATW
jgi:hypothetical protein